MILDSDLMYKYGETPQDLFNHMEFSEWGFIRTVEKFRKRYENPIQYFKDLEREKKEQEQIEKLYKIEKIEQEIIDKFYNCVNRLKKIGERLQEAIYSSREENHRRR